MNWTQQAENRVKEMISAIRFYMSEGVSKEKAIQIVKSETTISKDYWEMVLEAIA